MFHTFKYMIVGKSGLQSTNFTVNPGPIDLNPQTSASWPNGYLEYLLNIRLVFTRIKICPISWMWKKIQVPNKPFEISKKMITFCQIWSHCGNDNGDHHSVVLNWQNHFFDKLKCQKLKKYEKFIRPLLTFTNLKSKSDCVKLCDRPRDQCCRSNNVPTKLGWLP